MFPLEIIELPNNSDLVSTYVDGKHLVFTNAPFIGERILFVPVEEISKLWGLCIKSCEDEMILSIGDNRFFFNQFNVSLLTGNGSEILSYNVRKIHDTIYVDAFFFLVEIGITITWETDTHTAYFASVLHYDGYRVAPKEIFSTTQSMDKFLNYYMYVDGTICLNNSFGYMVDTKNGLICMRIGSHRNFEKQKEYRFCFRYMGTVGIEEYPVGDVLEVCEPNNDNKIGNMIYAQSNWDGIVEVKAQREEYQNKGILDKNTLTLLIKQYPEVLTNKGMFQGYLKDYFPKSKKEINLIMLAVDDGIFADIDKRNVIDETFVYMFSKKLVDNYGIQTQLAIDTVCLCCDVYGSRIKGKPFNSNKQYNEIVMLMLQQRERDWIEPYFSDDIALGELSYRIPEGWGKKNSEGIYEGTYYYPYYDDKSMIWVCRRRLFTAESNEKFDYISFAKAISNGAHNVISIIDYIIDGVVGKKINHYMCIGSSVFENDSYYFPYNGYLYGIIFMENTALSRKMREFEDRFIHYFSWD